MAEMDDRIAQQLFDYLRTRFPSLTIGDEDGNVSTDPKLARYFEFDYVDGDLELGQITCTLDNDQLSIMYNDNIVGTQEENVRKKWYDFVQGLRQWSMKRACGFEIRNLAKSSNTTRDYEYLKTESVSTKMINLREYINKL